MNFIEHPGLFEYCLTGIFLLAYLVYIIRSAVIAKALQTSFSRIFIKMILRFIIMGLFIIALLGPSFGEFQKKVKSVGKDIFISVDLSQSMDVGDIQPSRLEKVKHELKNVTQAFYSDRIGLIVFTSEAAVKCPLTQDHKLLNTLIETLHTDMFYARGTDFEPGLQLALNKHMEIESKGPEKKSQIIILISDGEDFGGEVNQVAEEIKDKDIKVFTLGIGTERGDKVPANRGYVKNEKGEVVTSSINREPLQEIADMTGGKYYEISNNRNDVKEMINDIRKIEGQTRNTTKIDTSSNKYYYFLLAGLILLIIDRFITINIIRLA